MVLRFFKAIYFRIKETKQNKTDIELNSINEVNNTVGVIILRSTFYACCQEVLMFGDKTLK